MCHCLFPAVAAAAKPPQCHVYHDTTSATLPSSPNVSSCVSCPDTSLQLCSIGLGLLDGRRL